MRKPKKCIYQSRYTRKQKTSSSYLSSTLDIFRKEKGELNKSNLNEFADFLVRRILVTKTWNIIDIVSVFKFISFMYEEGHIHGEEIIEFLAGTTRVLNRPEYRKYVDLVELKFTPDDTSLPSVVS